MIPALLLAAALALAALPVWLLTRPQAPALPSPAPAQSERRAVIVTVTSTAPTTVRLTAEGKILWASEAPILRIVQTLDLPAGELDLVAEAQWRGAGSHAVRFQISRDGEALADATLWGETRANAVISLP